MSEATAFVLGLLDRLVALRWWILTLVALALGYRLHILPHSSAEALLWIKELGKLVPGIGG